MLAGQNYCSAKMSEDGIVTRTLDISISAKSAASCLIAMFRIVWAFFRMSILPDILPSSAA